MSLKATIEKLKDFRMKKFPNSNINIKIKLLYFKSTGKYYSEGIIECKKNRSMYEVIKLIKEKREQDTLPNIKNAQNYIIYVDSSEHPLGYPILILIDKEE